MCIFFLGSELEVVTDLILEGVWKYLDVAMIEFHLRPSQGDELRVGQIQLLKNVVTSLGKLISKPLLTAMDDETYRLSHFPLPQCVR